MSDKENNNQQDKPESQSNFPTISLPDSSAVIGGEIGPYKLLSVLGEGGFGIVYLAEQKRPVKRQVALKIIKPGMDTKQVIARFEAEQQALALLEHPNIAHVFRAGSTETGRPYFVMEYIKGSPITEYCDHNQLNIKERLKLFIQVCEAIQHAHQKGIIHRDIKPSNIVVSVQDGKAVPKVIDFGVAKAISMPLTEKTMFTQQGQLIGTPEYMSPEQADLKEKDIDTRTDIYSLGVVLYELLAGALPFDPETLREGGYAEIQRIIREQEPPRPSTKLSSLGENGTKIAQSRHIELSTLVKSLHKELEWIPLMAIRKERDQRYKTASDLAEDVQNYLDGNPLVAGPESIAYRLRKFARRNQVLVVTSSLIVILLIVGIATSTFFAIGQYRAKIAEGTARLQAENATEKTRRSLYANKIALIHSEYKSANTSNVKRLLEECPEDLRNWEYDYLKKISDQSLMTLKAHDGLVSSISFTPDSSKIVSASLSDQTVRVWNSVTGEQLKILDLGPEVSNIAIHPNGKQVVTSGKDNTIKLWNIETESLLKTFVGHKHPICSVLKFDSEGDKIASADAGCDKCDPTIKIWNINTGKEILSIQRPGVGIHYMDFSPDGTRLTTTSYQAPHPTYHYELRVWDLLAGELIQELPKTYYSDLGVLQFWGVEFDNTGTKILTANLGQAWVWDTDTLQIKTAIPDAHNYISKRASFSPDCRNIVTGGIFGSLKLWNSNNGKLVRTLHGHTSMIYSIAYSSDGTSIASGDTNGVIKLWNAVVDHEKNRIATIPKQQNRSFSINPEGTIMAAGTPDGFIRLLDTNRWEDTDRLYGHSGTINAVSFSPDGTYLVSAGEDMSIRIWDINTEPPSNLYILQGHSDSVNTVQYSPEGEYIASGSSDGTVKIWNSNTGNLIKTFHGHDSSVNAIQYTYDGKQIISGSNDSTVKLWEVETGKCLKTYDGHESGVTCLALAPNNRTFFSGDRSGIGIDWEKDSGKMLTLYKGHLRGLKNVCYSRDGKRIFSGSEDGCIRVWDTETGQSLLTLENYNSGGIWGLVSVHDGNTFYSIPIWDSSSILIYSSKYLDEYAEMKTSESRIEYYKYTANLYCELGFFEEAVESNKKIIELDPSDKVAFNDLMSIYHTLSLQEVVEICEKTNWRDWFYLGWIASKYSEVGNIEKALKWQQEAINIMPETEYNNWLSRFEYALKLYGSSIPYSKGGQWSFSHGELVAHWDFEKVENGTVFDSSGNKLNGKLVGNAKIVEDSERGEVLSLDGNGSYVDCGNNWKFDISGSITISAWIKVNLFDNFCNAVIAKDGSWRLQRALYSDNIDFACSGLSNNQWGSISGHINVNDNQWHHVAGVYDGKSSSLYIDGKFDFSVEAKGNILVDRNPVNIGLGSNADYEGNSAPRYWNGLIDDVRIHSYALSKDEIESLAKRKDEVILNDLAWSIISSHPDDNRDIQEAIEDAIKACGLTDWKNWDYLKTLAAANSEAGNYEEAVKLQKEATNLLPADQQTECLGKYEYLLKLYKSNKPYHMGGPWSLSHGELVGYWDFEKVEGKTVIDASGNGLDGKLVGNAEIVDDPERDKVLKLDGNGSYVDCGNDWEFDITGSITVASWVKVEVFDRPYQSIISKGDTSWRLLRAGEQNVVEFGCRGITNYQNEWGNTEGNISVNDGQWHHVVGVYDGEYIYIYVDGVEDKATEASGRTLTNDDHVFIGTYPAYLDDRCWNGLIDDVRVYSYALSAEEISELYKGESIE